MSSSLEQYELEEQAVRELRESGQKIREQLSQVIIGQQEVIDQLLISLFAGGHCLITGAPGLAKTLLVRTISQIFDLEFSRIQFTPDLMPADITGTEILEESEDGGRRLQFVKGPILSTLFWLTKLTGRLPKPRLLCWNRCRSIK